MQSVSSRIWTRVAVFISDEDNHYTTGILQTFPTVTALVTFYEDAYTVIKIALSLHLVSTQMKNLVSTQMKNLTFSGRQTLVSLSSCPLEKVIYEFATSTGMTKMSCSSNMGHCEMGGKWPYSSCFAKLMSKGCKHTVVLRRIQLGRNPAFSIGSKTCQ